eukprot:TRINITY_DN2659_c1_g2_i4.p1 TRINITY_DN2659_c1_g2~~TRINITY_DN2659_c1_g2_i4.p1  ORF type:complete len:274 (+),score=-18.41 TRINITY_DN2659_c1_g2_i4:63-824(+)
MNGNLPHCLLKTPSLRVQPTYILIITFYRMYLLCNLIRNSKYLQLISKYLILNIKFKPVAIKCTKLHMLICLQLVTHTLKYTFTKSRCTPLDIKTIVVFPSHPLSLSTSKSQHTTQLHYNKHQFTSSKCVISQHTHTHAYVRKRQKRGKNISYDYLQNNTSKIQFPTLTKFHSEKKLYQGKKYPKSFQTNIFEPLQNSFARKQKLPTNKGKLFKQMISDYFFSHNDIPNLSGGQLNIKKIFLSPQCKNADIRV